MIEKGRAGWILFISLALSFVVQAQQPLTWEQVRARFQQNNPALLADELNIDESKASEITAFLRPNPTLSLSADGTQIVPDHGVWQPFRGTFFTPSISYLLERQHKRELRLESAQKATLIARSNHADTERTPIMTVCWESAEPASVPATSLKSISTGSNCSACSMNPTCRML
jgi:cobalt-zinc-cadmium efflux system outer membrane protein